MKKVLLIIATYLLFISLNAQSFERLEKNSLCYGYEDQEGDFYILSYVDKENRNVLKLSAKGDSLWQMSYPVQNQWSWNDPIIEGLNGELLILYSHYFRHNMPYCYMRICYLERASGSIIKHENVLSNIPDPQKVERIFDFKVNDSTYQLLYEKGHIPTDIISLNLSEDLEVLSADTIKKYHFGFLSDYEDIIYGLEFRPDEKVFNKLNYKGDVLGSLDLGKMTPAKSGRYKITENQDYIAIVQPSLELDQGAHIFVIEREEFKVVQSKYFANHKIKDIKLLSNNQIIGVKGHIGSPELSLEKPVKVMLLDEELNIIKEKNYASPRTSVLYLGLTNDQKGFYVSGYRYFEKESYFLKDEFTNLEPVYRPMDEAPLGVNVFPNPTSGLVKILIDPAVSLPVELRLVSTAGQVMQELDVTSHTLSLDLSALPIGVYHLVLESGEESRTEKIVKMW